LRKGTLCLCTWSTGCYLILLSFWFVHLFPIQLPCQPFSLHTSSLTSVLTVPIFRTFASSSTDLSATSIWTRQFLLRTGRCSGCACKHRIPVTHHHFTSRCTDFPSPPQRCPLRNIRFTKKSTAGSHLAYTTFPVATPGYVTHCLPPCTTTTAHYTHLPFYACTPPIPGFRRFVRHRRSWITLFTRSLSLSSVRRYPRVCRTLLHTTAAGFAVAPPAFLFSLVGRACITPSHVTFTPTFASACRFAPRGCSYALGVYAPTRLLTLPPAPILPDVRAHILTSVPSRTRLLLTPHTRWFTARGAHLLPLSRHTFIRCAAQPRAPLILPRVARHGCCIVKDASVLEPVHHAPPPGPSFGCHTLAARTHVLPPPLPSRLICYHNAAALHTAFLRFSISLASFSPLPSSYPCRCRFGRKHAVGRLHTPGSRAFTRAFPYARTHSLHTFRLLLRSALPAGLPRLLRGYAVTGVMDLFWFLLVPLLFGLRCLPAVKLPLDDVWLLPASLLYYTVYTTAFVPTATRITRQFRVRRYLPLRLLHLRLRASNSGPHCIPGCYRLHALRALIHWFHVRRTFTAFVYLHTRRCEPPPHRFTLCCAAFLAHSCFGLHLYLLRRSLTRSCHARTIYHIRVWTSTSHTVLSAHALPYLRLRRRKKRHGRTLRHATPRSPRIPDAGCGPSRFAHFRALLYALRWIVAIANCRAATHTTARTHWLHVHLLPPDTCCRRIAFCVLHTGYHGTTST